MVYSYTAEIEITREILVENKVCGSIKKKNSKLKYRHFRNI